MPVYAQTQHNMQPHTSAFLLPPFPFPPLIPLSPFHLLLPVKRYLCSSFRAESQERRVTVGHTNGVLRNGKHLM